jgi:acetyltransferase-like isoleucine patch superfamily enzyme/dTDP-4-dehydrorhamnose 3,5-epimerase-like enzyme
VTESFFVHPQGLCESTAVGERSRIWAFAHVLPGAVIGTDANICDNVFVENDVVIGDRVTVKCGVHIWDGLRVGDDVFIGPNATFANDRFPRSKDTPEQFLVTEIHDGASIGANATVLPGLTIGRRAMVGAGTVVTADVPANAKVVGNPGRIIGYVDDVALDERQPDERHPGRAAKPDPDTFPEGVAVIDIPNHTDLRGSLAAAEVADLLPFAPQRYFVVFDVPSQDVRGEHAHRRCSQFLTCLAGSLVVHLDDGQRRAEVTLDARDRGVLIPPMVWASQFKYSADAVLLVLASHRYDPDDYIRDYDDFLALAAGGNAPR